MTSSAGSGGGETRENPSGWTVDTLRAYMQTQVDMLFASEMRQMSHLQLMLDERYLTQTKAVDAAFTAQQTAMVAALAAAETAVSKALEAAEKAVLKAEIAADKRFASVNEFRDQLNDQATTFMPRREAEAGMTRNAERIAQVSEALSHTITQEAYVAANRHTATRLSELTDTINLMILRTEFNAIHDALLVRVQDITDRVNRSEGSSGGANANRAQLISFISAATAIIAIIVTVYVAFKSGP
jgi:hypothetical protein